jgi:eukaryotic-like serine/threonine-protein kinase
MEPDRFARAKEILLAVADLPPPERAAYLDRECAGDPELRAEVESILAHDGHATAHLKSPAPSPRSPRSPQPGEPPRSPRPDDIAEARTAPLTPEPSPLIGQSLSHYRIESKLGEGGMGEVYLARDERLDREVALKVLLRGTLADEAARRRLRREALALSKLNHPNIATVFDFDSHEDVDFLVMEYVAGQGLEEKLSAGPLPEREVLRLGQQLAEGLSAAHGQGVIHRDLKPGNVRLTVDGRLKILDFGLAKQVARGSETATTESIAQAGSLVGTLPYMAPEQVRGEVVDERTDIWAAGLVLYELATGRRAFGQGHQASVIAAIVSQAPVAPSRVNARISAGLEGIIAKCLEKDPENRYQSAKELVVDLRRLAAPSSAAGLEAARPGRRGRRVVLAAAAAVAVVAAAAALIALDAGGVRGRLFNATPRIQSLAVLPLQDLSAEPQPEYFVAGMTEGLINELGKVAALHILPSSAVVQYKGVPRPPGEIAGELGVDAVVTGSVTRSGDRVRISAEMIQAGDGRQLWSGSYERDLRDVQFLQGGMAQTIANVVRARMTTQEQSRLAAGRPVNPEAYEAYLQGSQIGYPHLRAVPYYRQAIRIDSTFALAYAGLSAIYTTGAIWGEVTPGEAVGIALPNAARAVELDDGLAEAHSALAYAKYALAWDFEGAKREFERARELNPGNKAIQGGYSVFLVYMMESPDEAIEMVLRDWQDNPRSSGAVSMVGWVYFYLRRYDEALEWLLRARDMPGFSYTWLLSMTYACKGMQKEALALVDSVEYEPVRGWVLAVAGRRDLALAKLDELRRKDLAGDYVAPVAFAATYAGLGNKEETLAWLRKGVAARDIDMICLKVEPYWDGLRSDPRFEDLLRQVGFPPSKP